MRVDKLLANMGCGSRKEVKKMLKTGVVKVDGEVIKDGKAQVNPNEQVVSLHGEVIEYKENIYLMMNKPKGVISATEDEVHSTVIDLLEAEDQIFEVFPVGRLDIDTEGLLLLTDDGKLAHQLLSPKKHVPKTYYAKINGKVTEDDIQKFEDGVMLDDGYITQPGLLKIIRSDQESTIELTITEGKFHQVKRMFEAVNKKVIYLMRTKMGPLLLDEQLKPGEYRELTEDEVSLLKGEYKSK